MSIPSLIDKLYQIIPNTKRAAYGEKACNEKYIPLDMSGGAEIRITVYAIWSLFA
jgi:hypothetical protein